MLRIIQSQLLLDNGVSLHGFTTREGGLSEGPWAFLNLSFEVGEEPETVLANLSRLRAYLRTEAPLLRVRQVHGAEVVEASTLLDAGLDGFEKKPSYEADAIVGRAGQGTLAVATADCVPVLLVDPTAGVCAAVHAGWRGTKAGIVRAAVRSMARVGAEPQRLLAALGPRICEQCYEVGAEVARHFPESCDEKRKEPGKFSLDLGNAVEVSLIAAGLRGDRIDMLPHCTACEPELFYSHRKSGGNTGRGLAFIGLSVS